MKTPTNRWILLGLLIGLAMPITLMAQNPDVEGSKDHPLLTRMPKFYINDYLHQFDLTTFEFGEEQSIQVEGMRTFINYIYQEESGFPSAYQVVKNYITALTKLGGEVVYKQNDIALMKATVKGCQVWVYVMAYDDGWQYDLTIVEEGEMTQEVTASALLSALNEQGHVAVYINFDTGKADISPDSKAIIDEIAQVLNDEPDLKLRIEGHTDNVGADQANMTLSESRARAVAKALVQKGIEAGRLVPIGKGETQPIGDNATEEGRAKNRRVELVKIG